MRGVHNMPILRPGKVPPELLDKHVFSHLGVRDAAVIHGPGIGRDAALIRVGRQVVVATTDPITGTVNQIGSYVLHICANDVATFGVEPRWFLTTILLPENADESLLKDIMISMHTAAEDLNVSIIGGHTEITTGLTRPIVIGFMLGITGKGEYVTSTAAKPGNTLILTKGVAIEGTAILATERADQLRVKLGRGVVDRAQQFIDRLSVVPEALKAMAMKAVTAMHDPTEGGVANGLHEIADASGVGFVVHRNALVIHEETRKICQALDINPLNLIASGAMIMAVKANKAKELVQALEQEGISASIIGHLVKDPSTRQIIESNGSKARLHHTSEDALWTALEKPLDD
jgi:hydrogenase expression/formation protein HypE